MICLTVWQPWASAIIYGAKDRENRGWPTSHRGELAIHAAASKVDWDAPDHAWTAAGLMPPPRCQRFDRSGWTGSLQLGQVLGVVDLSGCHRSQGSGQRLDCPGCTQSSCCQPWGHPAAWHWEVTAKRPLTEPIPCRGAQRLWRLPEQVEKLVRDQLEAGQGVPQ